MHTPRVCVHPFLPGGGLSKHQTPGRRHVQGAPLESPAQRDAAPVEGEHVPESVPLPLLSLASLQGHEAMVSLLLDHKADVWAVDHEVRVGRPP